MADVELYYGPGSVAFGALIALEECGADYRAHQIRLADGEQRKPAFLAMNPRGQVPVLRTDDALIRENIGVLSFIAFRYPGARLLPFAKPVELARCYEFLSWFATNLHVAIAQIFRSARFTPDEAAQGKLKEQGPIAFMRTLEEFEKWADTGNGKWIIGDHLTLADLLAPVAARWARRLEIDPAAYPAFEAIADRVMARPASQRALKQEQAG